MSLKSESDQKGGSNSDRKIIFTNTLFVHILETEEGMRTGHKSINGFEDSAGNYFGYSWIG